MLINVKLGAGIVMKQDKPTCVGEFRILDKAMTFL